MILVRTTHCRLTRQHGLTLLELTVVLAVSGVIFLLAGTTLIDLQGSVVSQTVTASTEDTARRVLDRLMLELRNTRLGSVRLDSEPARSITFSTIEGWDGSRPISSPPKTLAFDPASGTVSLDGRPIGADLGEVLFRLDGAVLTIVLECRKSFSANGDERSVTRQLQAEIKL